MDHLFDGELVARWSLFGINVLVQLAIICGLALAAAVFLRRRPAERHALLLGALLLIVGTPVLLSLIPAGSVGLVRLPLTDAAMPTPGQLDSPPSADRSRERLAGSASPSSVTDSPAMLSAHETDSPPAQQRGSLVAEAHDIPAANGNRLVANATESKFAANSISNSVRARTVGWLRFVPAILMLCSLGTLFLLGRLVRGSYRLRLILREAGPISSPRPNQIFADVCRSLGIQTPPPLVESPGISVPCAAGIWKPRVLLPGGLCESLSSETLEQLLRHEAAHIVRHDPAVVLLQNLAGALFWIHPLIHVLNRQLARSREELCDNHVLGLSDPHDYGRTLLRMAERGARPRLIHGSVGLFTSAWRLESRIAGILDENRILTTDVTASRRGALAGLLILIAAAAAVGSVSPATEPLPNLSPQNEASRRATDSSSFVDLSPPATIPLEFAMVQPATAAGEAPSIPRAGAELDRGRVDDPKEKMRLLDMLAEADRANRDSIATWTGSGTFSASRAWGHGPDSGSSRVVRQAQLNFSIDRKANRLFVEWKDVLPPRLVGAAGESGKLLTRNLSRFRSIVNNEEWLDFRAALPYRGDELPLFQFDASVNPRVLMIHPALAAQSAIQESEGLINPTLWTSTNGVRVNSHEPFFAGHHQWAKAWDQKARESGKEPNAFTYCDVLRQERKTGPVLVVRRFTSHTEKPVRHAPDTMTCELTFDERFAFALTRCEYFLGRKTMESAEIDYQKRGVSPVPIRFLRKSYEVAGASQPAESIEIKLERSEVNQAIAASEFDVGRLGLQEGDRILNRQHDRRFVIEQGRWSPVEKPPKERPDWQAQSATSLWSNAFTGAEWNDLVRGSVEIGNRLQEVNIDELSPADRKAHFDRNRAFWESQAERYITLHPFQDDAHHKHLTGLNCLAEVIRMEYAGAACERAARMLLKEKTLKGEHQMFALLLAYSSPASLAAETVLRGMIEKSESRPTQAQARMSLAKCLARNAQRKRMMAALPAHTRRVVEDYGEWYANRLEEVDPDAAEAEAEKLWQQVIDDYSTEGSLVENGSLTQQARRDLLCLQRAVGRRAPEITGTDFSNKPLRLSETDGKVRVLMFWGNWCGPCRRHYAHLRDLMARHANAPFEVLGVCSDKNRDAIRKPVEAGDVTWRFWWDGNDERWRIHKEWGLMGAPFFFVLDKEGIVRFAELRGSELGEAVDLLLKETRE